MSLRARIAGLAILVLAAGSVPFSGAVLTASSSNPDNLFAASAAFSLSVSLDDPSAYLRGTVPLEATASDGGDGSTIASVTIERSPAGLDTWTDVCTDPTAPYSCSFDTTSVADGLYDLRARVLNDLGESDTSPAVAGRRVDNTAPGATMTDPGTPIAGTKTFAGSASDAGSGVASVTFQSSPAGLDTWSDLCSDPSDPYACDYDTALLADGSYDFRAVAVDNAGNPGASTVWSGRVVDNQGPTVTMTDPGAPIAGTKTFAGSASDAGSGVASVTFQSSPAGLDTWSDLCSDPSDPYACDYDTALLADGSYDFRAVAVDGLGNPGTSSVWTSRVVDNGFPSVAIDDPGAYLRLSVTLSASADDGTGSGILSVAIERSPAGADTWTTVCSDGSAPYSCLLDTTTLTDGLYDLRAVATDNAGHAIVSVVADRRVDNTAPGATMTDPGTPIAGTKTFAGSASDGGSGVASVTFQSSPAGLDTWSDLCSDPSDPYACDYDTALLADGSYDFRAVAVDNAGNTGASAAWAARVVDNAFPGVTMNDPGAYLRATVSLTASADDGTGSGILSVAIERSPAGADTWTPVCTDATSPYSCSFDTTTVADGLYDFRAVATDNAAHASASVVGNRRVDNTAPTAVDIQTANGGATAGRPETNDSVTFTYSEQIDPVSILTSWTGASSPVTVRIVNQNGPQGDRLEIWDELNFARLPLTNAYVSLVGDYVPNGGATFAGTMVQSGASITITLGALTSGSVKTDGTNRTMSWPPSTTATDLAGNPCDGATATESGAGDPEF